MINYKRSIKSTVCSLASLYYNKSMQKYLLFGFGGLLIGILGTNMFYQSLVTKKSMKEITPMPTVIQQQDHTKHDMTSAMTMDAMMKAMNAGLLGKTGDTFDKAFLTEMIVHHQGAIDMAKLAQKQAKHEELVELSENIITAQTNEIEQMKKWQKEWGYQK